ncbi:MAG TPA: DUF1259 domain-containing protein [Terriglobales bacterium]|nr:DUF1259 domain-containing protein [Terriglobales bacterium]
MTGEIPLLEKEVENFEASLRQSTMDISAVHNHQIQEQPRLIFIHIETFADPATIASALRSAIDTTGASLKESRHTKQTVSGVDLTKTFI